MCDDLPQNIFLLSFTFFLGVGVWGDPMCEVGAQIVVPPQATFSNTTVNKHQLVVKLTLLLIPTLSPTFSIPAKTPQGQCISVT